jgi:hypothetical protein
LTFSIIIKLNVESINLLFVKNGKHQPLKISDNIIVQAKFLSSKEPTEWKMHILIEENSKKDLIKINLNLNKIYAIKILCKLKILAFFRGLLS